MNDQVHIYASLEKHFYLNTTSLKVRHEKPLPKGELARWLN